MKFALLPHLDLFEDLTALVAVAFFAPIDLGAVAPFQAPLAVSSRPNKALRRLNVGAEQVPID